MKRGDSTSVLPDDLYHYPHTICDRRFLSDCAFFSILPIVFLRRIGSRGHGDLGNSASGKFFLACHGYGI